MDLGTILKDLKEGAKIRRVDWPISDYLVISTRGDNLYLSYPFGENYFITLNDVLVGEWEVYSPVGYVALYLQKDGNPGHYVINEQQYLKAMWPKFNYISDWIRYEGN